jgi:hypothetical protein
MKNSVLLVLSAAFLTVVATGCTTTTESITFGPLTDSCTDGNCVDTILGQQTGTCDAGDRVALNSFISVCPDTQAVLNHKTVAQAPVQAQITVQNANALGVNSVEVRTESGAPVAVNFVNSNAASIAFTNPASAISVNSLKVEQNGDHAVITVPNADQISVSLPSSMQQ